MQRSVTISLGMCPHMTPETNSEGRIFPLVEHFNWQRWGLVRRKIYSLAVGQSTRFAPTQKTASVQL